MWEKINKVIIQNAVSIIAILCCFALAFVAAFKNIPSENQQIVNKVIDVTLVGVIGWLFTQSKNKS